MNKRKMCQAIQNAVSGMNIPIIQVKE